MSLLKVNSVQDLGADPVVVNGVVDKGALPSGSVLQVVSVTKTDAFSSTSTSFTTITGLSATITPRATNSRILITVSLAITGNTTDGSGLHYRIDGGNSSAYVGDAAGSRVRAAATMQRIGSFASEYQSIPVSMSYLDSPNTTSAVTYNVQGRAGNAGTFIVNRAGNDPDNANNARTASTITVMEIAG